MILVYFAFAWWGFIIASNLFESFGAWLISAAIVFALFAIIFTYELWTLLGIAIGLLAILTIGILISKL